MLVGDYIIKVYTKHSPLNPVKYFEDHTEPAFGPIGSRHLTSPLPKRGDPLQSVQTSPFSSLHQKKASSFINGDRREKVLSGALGLPSSTLSSGAPLLQLVYGFSDLHVLFSDHLHPSRAFQCVHVLSGSFQSLGEKSTFIDRLLRQFQSYIKGSWALLSLVQLVAGDTYLRVCLFFILRLIRARRLDDSSAEGPSELD